MVWHVDNKTAPLVKPRKQPVFSDEMRYFTDEIGQTPTTPQADWFNMIQGEVVQLALSLGVAPDKLDDGQIGVALGKALTKINTDISKLPKIIDALGDSRVDGTSQRIVNTVNKLAKDAQTAANLANDKANQAKQEAYEADQKAVAAQTKANQVPNPIKDQFLIGNTATGYKLMTAEQVKALLAIPKQVNVVNEVGQSTTDAISQKAFTDSLNTASLSESGWHKDTATGLITQWGNASVPWESSITITMPIAFESGFIGVNATVKRTGTISNGLMNVYAQPVGQIQITLTSDNLNGTTVNTPVFWVATGY